MKDCNQSKSSEHSEDEIPQVFDITQEGRSFKFTRRDFIKVAGVLSASVASAGCASTQGLQVVGLFADPTDTPQVEDKQIMPTEAPAPTEKAAPTKAPLKPTSTPRPTRTTSPTRTSTSTQTVVTAAIRKQGVNLRSGPATYYYAIGSLAANVKVIVIARLPDSSWLNVLVNLTDLPILLNAPIAQERSDVEGWIRADLLEILEGSIEDLPEKEAPPTPTPLPNEKPTGEDGITYKYTDLYGNTYTYTLPCGSPIPEGAICSCNCVSLCSCVGHVAPPACSCDNHSGGTICTCNLVTYWYPN